MNRFLQKPFIDQNRSKEIRSSLVKAYEAKDRDEIAKAATDAQKYVVKAYNLICKKLNINYEPFQIRLRNGRTITIS